MIDRGVLLPRWLDHVVSSPYLVGRLVCPLSCFPTTKKAMIDKQATDLGVEDYMVGTMIELPRAALQAGVIAESVGA